MIIINVIAIVDIFVLNTNSTNKGGRETETERNR